MNTAKIVAENGHQLVRLPHGFHLEGDEVGVKRVGWLVDEEIQLRRREARENIERLWRESAFDLEALA